VLPGAKILVRGFFVAARVMEGLALVGMGRATDPSPEDGDDDDDEDEARVARRGPETCPRAATDTARSNGFASSRAARRGRQKRLAEADKKPAEAEAALGAAVLQEALAEGPVSSSDDGNASTRAAEEGLTAARSCSLSEEGNTAIFM
jgi:hypothetical protein